MNPFDYKDGKDFLAKTGMTIDAALKFLDLEIKIRSEQHEEKKQQANSQRA